MRLETEYGSASVVLLGSFNPRIFTPDWLLSRGLISEAEAADSEVNVIHAEISSFRVGTQNIQVEQNRFSTDTTEAPFIALSDFVSRLFGEVLPHTPIYRLGINRTVHFRVGSEEIRNKMGRKLAPLEPWGDWGREIDASPPEGRGGFSSLTMQKTRIDGELRGHTQANVQPSAIPSLGKTGIFICVNDDFVFAEKADIDKSEELLNLLSERFDGSMRQADQIIDQIMLLSTEVA